MRRRLTSCVLALGLVAVAVDGQIPDTTAVPAIRGLDHIPIAVNDLERAAARFKALGFVLKPGRPHANGIRNEHAKFPDGTELELITAPEARDDLTTKYRRHLSEGDGPAFLAFYAPPTFKPTTPVPAYMFFGGRQASPTDRPEHFAHPNGADAFISVWLAGDDLSRERALLQAHGATFARETVYVPDPMLVDVARLWEGDVLFLPGRRQRVKGRPIVGATIRVKNLEQARRAIDKPGTVVLRHASAESLFVAPESANGLWLEFRTAENGVRK
jgi:catechol 2,3-dioxygenase-like lactoylglutathione lyase family enzyme